MRRTAATGLVSFALLLTPMLMAGCLVHRSKHVSYTGDPVDHGDLSRVRLLQTTTSGAETLLGPPSSVRQVDDGSEVWTWRWRKTTSGEGRVFLLFNGSKTKAVEEEVHIRFRDGIAVDKWRG